MSEMSSAARLSNEENVLAWSYLGVLVCAIVVAASAVLVS